MLRSPRQHWREGQHAAVVPMHLWLAPCMRSRVHLMFAAPTLFGNAFARSCSARWLYRLSSDIRAFGLQQQHHM
jgi:hypothetical protein